MMMMMMIWKRRVWDGCWVAWRAGMETVLIILLLAAVAAVIRFSILLLFSSICLVSIPPVHRPSIIERWTWNLYVRDDLGAFAQRRESHWRVCANGGRSEIGPFTLSRSGVEPTVSAVIGLPTKHDMYLLSNGSYRRLVLCQACVIVIDKLLKCEQY